ncbi:hypothetical protein ABBQ38_006270 [Trebouxia sp. C0009 RCD-2024]
MLVGACLSWVQLCRAARFCNGAAHGGQVVGPSAIIPGLLQAWGCEKLPDGQSLGPEAQISGQASPGKSAPADLDLTNKAQQDLLKASYPNHDPSFSFGVGPQTPWPGRYLPPDASTAPRETSLSAVRSGAHPNFGDPADPQKLAASWVTNQQFGDRETDRGAGTAGGPALWAHASQPQPHPLPTPSGPLYMHRKSSTVGRRSRRFTRLWSAKQPRPSALMSELGQAGSESSLTALMMVAETEDAADANSEKAVTARASLDLPSTSMRPSRSELSESGDMMESSRTRHSGSALQSLQLNAERSAVSVSSLASSDRCNDGLLEALSEVML